MSGLYDRTTAYDAYRRALLTPSEVKQYSQLRTLRPVYDAALAWLCIGAAWWAAAHWLSVWSVALAIPVIGSRFYALFIIGHDGLHRRVFRKRWLNDLFNDVLVMAPIGAITRLNNSNHIRHHEQLARPGDPDRYKYTCLNKAELKALLAYVSGLGSVGHALRNVFLGGSKRPENSTQAAPSRRYALRDLAILITVQGALIGGLSATFGWWGYPVMWLVPVYVFTFQMDNFRTFAEHSHTEPDAKADQHRLISFVSNPVERMFFAPMNMNYHAVHHLWPSIPYYQLPAADNAVRNKPEAQGLEWRHSYTGFVLRYARALPLDCE